MLEQKIEELTAAVVALTQALKASSVPDKQTKKSEAAQSIAGEQDKPKSDTATNSVAASAEVPNGKSQTTSDTSQSSAPESEPVTYDDVKRATNAVSKIKRSKAIAGLARFGVESATKLAEAQWPEYVAYMTRVAAGEVDPEASHE